MDWREVAPETFDDRLALLRASDSVHRAAERLRNLGVNDDIGTIRARNRSVVVLVKEDEPPDLGYDYFDFEIDEVLDYDLETLSSLISVIAGSACAEMAMDPDKKLSEEQVGLYESLLEKGFSKLSDQGQERLGPILDTLQSQLADMGSSSVNPHDISRYWSEQFDQYKDWEFARLARTESAFAQSSVKLESLKEDYDASEQALSDCDAVPPIHPNCMCDIQPMVINDRIFMYLDTQAETCPMCSDVADKVLDRIEELAAAA